jgi:O-antigen ligase
MHRALILTLLLTGGVFTRSTVVLVGVAILALPLVVHSFTSHLPKIHPVLPFVLLIFGGLFYAALAIDPLSGYGVGKTTALFTGTLFSAAAAALIRDRGDLEQFAGWWILVGVILAALAVTGWESAQGRSIALGANPIWLARIPASGIILVAILLFNKRMRARWALPLIMVLIAGVFATGSKGPLVAAVAGVLVTGFAAGRTRGRTVFGVVLALLLTRIIVASTALAGTRVGAFFLNPLGVDDPERARLWQYTLPVIRQNPEGVGLGNWSSATGIGVRDYPHNLWLEVLAEAGWVIGALVILATLNVLVRLYRRAPRDDAAALVLALLVGEVVNATLSGDINARSFWCFLALGFWVSTWTSMRRAPALNSHGTPRDNHVLAARAP